MWLVKAILGVGLTCLLVAGCSLHKTLPEQHLLMEKVSVKREVYQEKFSVPVKVYKPVEWVEIPVVKETPSTNNAEHVVVSPKQTETSVEPRASKGVAKKATVHKRAAKTSNTVLQQGESSVPPPKDDVYAGLRTHNPLPGTDTPRNGGEA